MRDLTKAELHHFQTKMNCVVCRGELLEGPSGGVCVNFKCARCDRVFNLCFASFGAHPQVFTGQLVGGDDYDYEEDVVTYVEEAPEKDVLGWGKSFAIAALVLMAIVLVVWVAMGGIAPGLAER